MINKRLERQKIERLLPWHAAGTLSRREADLVERALAGDTELAQRYDLVRQGAHVCAPRQMGPNKGVIFCVILPSEG
jgi:hypothetical protein